MKILVTGGAGYIGSHTCVELLEAGHDVVIADNLYNASEKAVERIGELTGKQPVFYRADLCDRAAMEAIFEVHRFDAVIHFAGYKAVGESDAGGPDAPPRREENHFQLVRHGVRGSGLRADHRRMPQGRVHQSLWVDQVDA